MVCDDRLVASQLLTCTSKVRKERRRKIAHASPPVISGQVRTAATYPADTVRGMKR